MIGFINAIAIFAIIFLFLKNYTIYQGETKIIYIKEGSSNRQIAELLEKEGIVVNKDIFYFYTQIKGKTLKAGYYQIKTGYSLYDIWKTLAEGKEIFFKFTIIPGENLYDIGEKLEKEGFIDDKKKFYNFVFNKENVKRYGLVGSSFEGYFPPETYFLSKSRSKNIDYLVKAFLKVFKRKYLVYKPKAEEKLGKLGLDFYDVMIIASMVEKETSVKEEKPIIAGVIIARLQKNMLLQIDPTVIYGLKQKGIWNGKLTKKNMKIYSDYNTYLVKGLPPTPICSFTVDSLKAVINYKKTDYLYYYSPNGKTHLFSKDYEEHKAKIRKFKNNKKK
ncbi:MAG: endolytic transglycosylase MltG [Persephonella sp.]|nr:MAG: endolytic transglycosylase MltG [Persephonella sp.]